MFILRMECAADVNAEPPLFTPRPVCLLMNVYESGDFKALSDTEGASPLAPPLESPYSVQATLFGRLGPRQRPCVSCSDARVREGCGLNLSVVTRIHQPPWGASYQKVSHAQGVMA